MFTWRRTAWAAGVVLLPSLFVARVAGVYAPDEPGHFDWSTAAVAGTGMATAMLAIWTGALALATMELTRIEHARFAREDEPHIIVGTVTWDPALPGEPGQVQLVNAGRGPAIGVRFGVHFLDEATRKELQSGPLEERGTVGVVLGGGGEVTTDLPTWRVPSKGHYRLRGVYRERDNPRYLVFGPPPSGGWVLWLRGRRSEGEWWGIADGPIDESMVEHR